MDKKRFMQIWIPAAVILSVIAIAVNIAMLAYSDMFDLMYGRGKRRIVYRNGNAYDAEYYSIEAESDAEAIANGKAVTYDVAKDGIVLLKNNGVLPLKKGADITPFGYHYLRPNYGPLSGSAALKPVGSISAEAAFNATFTVNADAENAMRKMTVYGLTKNGLYDMASLEGRADVVEFDPNDYAGIEQSCRGSVGVVFVGRAGGEGSFSDLTAQPLYDGTQHGAAFSEYERKTIEFAKRSCDKVVLIINCCNPMELGNVVDGELEADAVLWIGGTGSMGFKALADVMTGEVNPSGRLPDIYVRDATKNPVFGNYGNGFEYVNVTADIKNQIYKTFLEYEEGVYNGYRYYETAFKAIPNYIYGKLYKAGGIAEPGEVIYPFGYGLSYTEFTQKIEDFECDGTTVSLTVCVKNIGKAAGKDAVQIYFSPPYTELSRSLGMEKSDVTLAAFGKTELLSPGEKAYVKLEFNVKDMASYSSVVENGDGTHGCYVLESGDYTVSLRNNSHDVIESKTVHIPRTVYYNENGQAEYAKFDALTEYMKTRTTLLSRNDFAGTFPQAPTNFTAPQSVLDAHNNNKTFNADTDPTLGDVEGSEVFRSDDVISNANNGFTLADLRGADYDDPLWNELLDMLDYNAADVRSMISGGYMHIGGVEKIGLPHTEMRDGPLGITATMSDNQLGVTTEHNNYCAMPLLAATFDTSLAYEYGKAIATEAYWHSNGELPVSGIYAPGLNIHRGPFGGRYYEYLSEDPLLTGMMGAQIASGAAEGGVIMIIKHFAANNQDTGREGLNTFMTEQALREIYLKPYELCIKNAVVDLKYSKEDGSAAVKRMRAPLGVMTAKNNIGADFCAANRALVTEVLRNEWGFDGFVITDLIFDKNKSLYRKILRSGVNVLMEIMPCDAVGTLTPTEKHIIRESVHRVAYTVVNSNAFDGVPPHAYVKYSTSPWCIVLIVADCALGAVIVGLIILTLFYDKIFREKSDKTAYI